MGPEEAGNAPHRNRPGRHQMRRLADMIMRDAEVGEAAADQLPKFGQARNAMFRRVPRDQRGVDSADGNTRHPINADIERDEIFDHTRLIRAKRAAALKDKRHLIREGHGSARTGWFLLLNRHGAAQYSKVGPSATITLMYDSLLVEAGKMRQAAAAPRAAPFPAPRAWLRT